MAQPHYVTETQTLLRVANNSCRYKWTIHVLERMAERNISQPDVEFALINGQVILEELKSDRLWRAVGRDIDGKKIKVVVAVDEAENLIKVVTTF